MQCGSGCGLRRGSLWHCRLGRGLFSLSLPPCLLVVFIFHFVLLFLGWSYRVVRWEAAQYRGAIRACHKERGEGLLGMVADSTGNKAKPLFLAKQQCASHRFNKHTAASAGCAKGGWTTGKDQSLSGLVQVGGAPVDEDSRESLKQHIQRMTDRWKAGGQAFAHAPHPFSWLYFDL